MRIKLRIAGERTQPRGAGIDPQRYFRRASGLGPKTGARVELAAGLRPCGPGSRSRMNGEELADGVYGFETHGVVNWYLIEDGERLTAIDAGLSSSWDEFKDWIKARKRRISDLEAVVLTHAHVDHFGFAAKAR